MKYNKIFGIAYAVLAAALYGVTAPASKFLLEKISPTFLAALFYLGAAIGAGALILIRKDKSGKQVEASINKSDFSYTLAMILLDIAAPILLMFGITKTTAANASLLNNFEIVATALIAIFVFKENIDRKIWVGIGFITLSVIILSVENLSSFQFSVGSLLVIGAAICWGIENNCTRMLSLRDPFQVVFIKGMGSGIGSLMIAFFMHEVSFQWLYILIALVIGFFSYGIGISIYINAQRILGAAKTSAYYAVAPFIGVTLSLIFFKTAITWNFSLGILLMLIGTYFVTFNNHDHIHVHQTLEHDHRHTHNDEHHNHTHDDLLEGEHSHIHVHEYLEHTHEHTEDLHHIHHK